MLLYISIYIYIYIYIYIIYLTPKCNSAYGKYQSNDCIITHLILETETYSEPYFSQVISLLLRGHFFQKQEVLFQTSSLILIKVLTSVIKK